MMTKDIRDYVAANQILRGLHRRMVLSIMVPMSFYKSVDQGKMFTYSVVCSIRFIVCRDTFREFGESSPSTSRNEKAF